MPDTIFFDAPSAGGAQYDVRSGDDDKVLTFTFSDFVANVGDEESATLTSKVVWIPLPLRGDGDPVRVEVTVGGYAFCGATAGGTLMFRLSGAQTTIDFAPGTDREFVTTLSCSSSEVHGQVNVVVCLVAQRDGEKADPARLNVLSVDAQLVAP